MNSRVIVIDGKTYHSINEMPADIRQKYERVVRSVRDADNNNIPDAFENAGSFSDRGSSGAPDTLEKIVAGRAALNRLTIVVDGKEFNGLDNLPPDVRARYEEAMRGLDANGNGIPDFVEGMLTSANKTATVPASFARQTPRRSTPLSASPTITPDTSNGWMLVLTGLFIFAICAAGVASLWYFFLR